MRLPTILVFLTCLLGAQLYPTSGVDAQEIRKTIRDYGTDRVFTYAPGDPWNRSKMFNVQTGHYGKFYNCDGEESKRNSPYICWKPHTDRDFPKRVGLIEQARRDLTEVKQRIFDGAGPCAPDCGCSKCTSAPAPTSACGCAQCALNNAPATSQPNHYAAATKPGFSHRVQVSQRPSAEPSERAMHGLVRGKIIDPRPQPKTYAPAATAQKKGSFARNGLMDLIR
ncbi:MAG: hypothetical protein ACI814_003381 [Mariniblastus sp.]